MRASDALTAYAREALASGADRLAIAAALRDAGWSEGEISGALSAWIDAPGLPPVPRPRAIVSARDAFRHGFMFFALGMVSVNLNLLVFALIDTWFPDPLGADLANSGAIRWAIAGLVIAYPVWAITSLGLARDAERDPGQRRGAVGRWLTWGALFLAATTLLGNGVAVIAGFLGGDLTGTFLLKAATVAIIAGSIFAYYGADRREDTE
jgi:hypothetical protein